MHDQGTPEVNHTNRYCEDKFRLLFDRYDQLDLLIRGDGNGRQGLSSKVADLQKAHRFWTKVWWLAAGVIVPIIVLAAFKIVVAQIHNDNQPAAPSVQTTPATR